MATAAKVGRGFGTLVGLLHDGDDDDGGDDDEDDDDDDDDDDCGEDDGGDYCDNNDDNDSDKDYVNYRNHYRMRMILYSVS